MRSLRLACLLLVMAETSATPTVQDEQGIQPCENAALQYWLAFDLTRSAARFHREVDAATTDDKEYGFGVPVQKELMSVLEGDMDDALRHLHRAADLPYCEWGSDLRKDGPRIEAPYGERAHRLARYSLLRARWSFEHGEWDRGIDDVIATMIMGRHIGRDKIWFNIHYGCMIENMGVSTAAVYLPKIPKEAREQLSRRLASLPPLTTMREVVEHYDEAVDWAVERLGRDDGDESTELLTELFSPDEAKAILQRAGGERGLVKLALEARRRRPEYLALLSLPPDEFLREFNARFQPRIESNPLLAWLGPFYPEMRHEECTARCRLALLWAGIDVLQRGPAAINEHRDPYGDGNFEYAEFDGGFNLRSDLVYSAAEPINLDFGVRSK